VALNVQQAKFLKSYLRHGNATRAALEADYSENSAYSQGHDLLKHPEIKKAVQKHFEKMDITAEKVVREIGLVAFSNMGDYVAPSIDGTQLVPDFSGVTRDQLGCIQEIRIDETGGGGGDGKRERVQRTTFKLAPKLQALELLAKHFKLLTDKVEFGDKTLAVMERLAAGRKRAHERNVK
jgi:phage terminase small subunit